MGAMASNAPLVVFRIIFGLLMVLESWGAIATGWVHATFVEPTLTFPIAGLTPLRVLSGEWMYGYFAAMGCAAVGVMLGWRYRLSSFALAALWSACYLAQTSHYNNHYYLAALLAWGLALLPAAGRASMDVAAGRETFTTSTSPWVAQTFRIQLLIVFSYAAINKLYPGWLSGDYLRVNLGQKGDVWPLGWLVVKPGFQAATIWVAIVFDALVIPALWWRRTRILGFLGLVGFDLFNSLVFRIGIFPYMVIGLTVFFFSEATIERAFRWIPGMVRPVSPGAESPEQASPRTPAMALAFLALYFTLQVVLPLRHHLYRGDVAWTEEGHRMSWRMMLRSKWGSVVLAAEDAATGETWTVNHKELLTPHQERRIGIQPDFLYRYVQDLKDHYAARGITKLRLFARHSQCSLNGGPSLPLYDPRVDLAQVTWDRFGRNEWVVDRP